ncbi:MAG: MarR family transcriptional regulator [Leptospiraceae bacterium]|nr:MarR family transcriptional regulator [Leptospiraceae bacterium]
MAKEKFEIENQIGFNLHRVTTLYRRKLIQTLQDYKLTPEQWQILNILWKSETLSTSKIAEFTMQDLPSTLRSLQRLEAKDYIQKETDTKDKRIQIWKTTKQGKFLQKILPNLLLTSFEKYLDGFPKQKLNQINLNLIELLDFLLSKN